MPIDLKRLYKLVAGAPNLEDVINLLKANTDRVADIRTGFGTQLKNGQDSIQVREAATFILTDIIDQLRLVRNTEVQRKRGVATDEDDPDSGSDTTTDDDLI